MPTFNCSGCGRSIKVADQYAGKRVKCPGCQEAQRVPGGTTASGQAAVDLSGLDDSGGSSVRRLRQVLIGCGACQKTIKLPEGRMGGNVNCPKCGTLLQFDRFDLSKAKGDLIDMTHLELEPGDPLMDTGGYGSTLGGSAVSFGSAAGRSTSSAASTGGGSLGGSHTTAAGLGGSSSDSQTQMRELRELNELKHSGAISNDEYKRRKAEIYSGKTLALQAMSRSADGNPGSRPVLGRAGGGMSPLIKGLLAVAVLGVVAAVVYATVLAPATAPPADDPPTVADAKPPDGDAAPETGDAGSPEVADEGGDVDPAAAEAADPARPVVAGAVMPGLPSDPEVLAAAGAQGDPASTPAGRPASAPEDPDGESVDPSLTDASVDEGSDDPEADPQAGMVEPETAAPVEMRISEWPVIWEDYQPTLNQPIAQACEVVKRIVLRNDSALIGVSVGHAAQTMDDPAYVMYRREMTDILLNAADAEGVRDSLMVRDSDETFRVGDLTCQVVRASMRGRSDQAAIITTIQDGYSMSYWFAGSRRAYSQFLDTVGAAVLAPKL